MGVLYEDDSMGDMFFSIGTIEINAVHAAIGPMLEGCIERTSAGNGAFGTLLMPTGLTIAQLTRCNSSRGDYLLLHLKSDTFDLPFTRHHDRECQSL
jgi:hypothetical protein